MRGWPEILADCDRLLSPTDDNVATDRRTLLRTLSSGGRIPHHAPRKHRMAPPDSKSVVGGIPKIMPCIVHSVPSLPDARWLHPDDEDRAGES